MEWSIYSTFDMGKWLQFQRTIKNLRGFMFAQSRLTGALIFGALIFESAGFSGVVVRRVAPENFREAATRGAQLEKTHGYKTNWGEGGFFNEMKKFVPRGSNCHVYEVYQTGDWALGNEGTPINQLIVHIRDGEISVRSLITDRNRQGKGYATLVMRHLEEEFPGKKVIVRTSWNNYKSKALLKHWGFERADSTEQDQKEESIRYQKRNPIPRNPYRESLCSGFIEGFLDDALAVMLR